MTLFFSRLQFLLVMGLTSEPDEKQRGRVKESVGTRAVQSPVLKGFSKMARQDRVLTIQIGDGAGNPENPVVTAGAKVLTIEHIAQKLFTCRVEAAKS